ncbi:hypothetical protein BJ878DRAFT_507432 [Calycina marina]|uniref:Uncharacterized protein n=1 Tax=Calycina marina TaxID=1763456 RepID=A0A9P7Z2E3_9HELO|nr:hypothetical protein BJ878DRAFT_507432 [Calycina marina]
MGLARRRLGGFERVFSRAITALSVCFTTAMVILWSVYELAGEYCHRNTLTPSQLRVIQLNRMSQPICIGALSTSKISVACLIYRTQSPTNWRTGLLVVSCAFTVVLNGVAIVLMFTQCRSVELLRRHGDDRPDRRCIDRGIFLSKVNRFAARSK